MLATATWLSRGDADVPPSTSMSLASADEEVCESVVSCALRHMAKVGPLGAHPLLRGHYSNAGGLSSGQQVPVYMIARPTPQSSDDLPVLTVVSEPFSVSQSSVIDHSGGTVPPLREHGRAST